MPADRDSLADILDSVGIILDYTRGTTREHFENDLRTQDAVIRRIEIMGEAAKRVSEATRGQFPDIPWKELAGMRDRVIHGYDIVDLDIVWATIQHDLPKLKECLERSIRALDRDVT